MTYGIARIFRSTDVSAPQYNGATYGSLKDTLKAVLVDGYGSTAPLGWTKEYESGNIMVIRPGYGRIRPYVRIDDGVSTYGASVRVYTSMLDINNGTESMPSIDTTAYLTKATGNNTTNVPWIIIGDEAGFYLISKWGYSSYPGTSFYGSVHALQYIGFYNKYDARNMWNFCVFLGQTQGYLGATNFAINSSGTTQAMTYGYSGSLRGCDFNKGPVFIGTKGIGILYSGSNHPPGFIDLTTNVSKAYNAYVLNPIRITESKGSVYVVVGSMPGLFDPLYKEILDTSLTYANVPYEEYYDINNDLNIFFTTQNYNNAASNACPKFVIKAGGGFRNVL